MQPISLPSVRNHEMKRILFVMDVIEAMGSMLDPVVRPDARREPRRGRPVMPVMEA